MPAKKDKPASEAVDFEATVNNLEAIIATVENEGASLEESLEAFEVGIKLIRQAQQTLATAEQKVKLLLEQNEEPVASNFSEIQDKE
jgi:exodeoxyribonuclease VII small subunit